MCESEVICLNGNCKFNDASMDGNCAKGEEPQLYDCREAIIARRGVHGLLVSAAQNTGDCDGSASTNTAKPQSLCYSCRKVNICNPRNNYGIRAFQCGKYVRRSGTAAVA